jgi:hypothetical protein
MISLPVGKVKKPLQATAGRPWVGASLAASPSLFAAETTFSHTLADGITTSCRAGLGMVKTLPPVAAADCSSDAGGP